MNYNYTLKYRTFDSLLEDVKIDLRTLTLENRIDPAQLIKVAMRVNYDLGLRINVTKETILEVEKGRVRLPEDFFVMNYGLTLHQGYETIVPAQGTNVQDVTPTWRPWVEQNSCSNESLPEQPVCFSKCNDDTYQIIQVVNQERRSYRSFVPIRFRNSKFVDCNWPNLFQSARDEAWINDGWIYFNTYANENHNAGHNHHHTHDHTHEYAHDHTHEHNHHHNHGQDTRHIYINYQGTFTDENGDLLIPDHPMLNEYYEYAIKKRILENLIMDGENVTAQFQLVMNEYRAARNNALTIVNTPNFSEMQKVWAMNRKAMYAKYYDMFKSYNPYPTNYRINNVV
jgi:hypothetical protein